MNAEFIEVFITPEATLSFVDHGGYESRSESTMALFKEAFDQIQDKTTLKKKHFYVDLHDIAVKLNNELTFGYTIGDNVVSCPDFTFDKWIECHIDNYQNTVNRIIDAGHKKYAIAKLFWTGNLHTQPLRSELLRIGNLHPERMEIIPMEWKKYSVKGQMHDFTHYISLEDHTLYKYVIDCGAQGFSARLKFLLYTNRPLFLVDREVGKREYFYNHLVPFEHYIPVKADLSDLLARLDWAEQNYLEACRMADAARKFAIENLSKKKVIAYLSAAIEKNCSTEV